MKSNNEAFKWHANKYHTCLYIYIYLIIDVWSSSVSRDWSADLELCGAVFRFRYSWKLYAIAIR